MKWISTTYALLIPIAALIGIWLFVSDTWMGLNDPERWAVVLVGMLTLIFYLESAILKAKRVRGQHYGRALSPLNDALEQVHIALTKISRNRSNHTYDTIHENARKGCTYLAEALKKASEYDCAISIKYLRENKMGEATVGTFCRDAISRTGRNYSLTNTSEHRLDKNTDFFYLHENIEHPARNYYLSHCLPLKHHTRYNNSSFEVYGHPRKNRILRLMWWPLPYYSTLVVPICPGWSEDRSLDNLVGFLCVDSENMFAFKSHHDVELLTGFASGMYHLMKHLYP